MDRIKELNQLNEGVLQPYRKLNRKKTSIINNHLMYFLSIGLAFMVASLTTGVQSDGSGGLGQSTAIKELVILVLSVAIVVGLTSWTLSLYRAIIEKTANKDLTLTKSSFIPDFKEEFFKRGLKYIASTLLYGLGIGIVLGLILGITLPVIVGGFVSGSSDVMGALSGGLIGILAGVIFMFVALLALGVVISPFILPITTLYVYYGDDIGIIESIKLSFTIGKENYKKLLITSLKVTGVNILGMLAFGIGYIYTSVWGILTEIDVMSEILGVTLKEGTTFAGTYHSSKEPLVIAKTETTVEKEPVVIEEEYVDVELEELEVTDEDEVIILEEVDEVSETSVAIDESELSDEELVEEALAEDVLVEDVEVDEAKK